MAYRDDKDLHLHYHDLLRDIRIASPCAARWSNMDGDERVRHCAECDRKVYNLSAMKADEAVRVITETEGRRCLRLFRRHDGHVLTTDCPRGAHRRRVRRAVTASTVGVLSTAFVTALQPDPGGVRETTLMVRAEPQELEAASPHLEDFEDGEWLLGE